MRFIQKLFFLIDRNSRHQLVMLVVFSIFVSSIETIGISAIMPFIDVVTNFEKIQTNIYYQWVYNFFGFEKEVNFAIFFGLTLIIFYFFRGGLNLLNSYVMARFKQKLYAQITKKLFKVYMQMPFQIFTKKNSSYLTKTIITEASAVSSVFENLLLIMSETFVIVFLYILMLVVSWKITLIFTIVLLVEVLFLSKVVSRAIKNLGVKRAKIHAKFYEILNRFFANFKHIKLQDETRLNAASDDFSLAVDKYSKVNITNIYLKAIPRIFLETSGFTLVIFVLVSFLYLNQSNVSYILPTLSLFILALFRLLPSVNRIVGGYNGLMYQHKSIEIVIEDLKITQEDLKYQKISFDNEIKLVGVDFSFEERKILRGINLKIVKGEKIAFIGESGSGKSTLVDLIIGLYRPIDGEIRIDNLLLDKSNLQNWRSQVGYIPQQVYLFDGTIADNVCFGREMDMDLLYKVLKQANIYDFLESKQGIKTLVGEGGIQLSGGQKQRIAIARALYGKPEILILDEATSALDEKTEKKIMTEIYQISQNKTLIVVAHRLSTINNCDKVYEVRDGFIHRAV